MDKSSLNLGQARENIAEGVRKEDPLSMVRDVSHRLPSLHRCYIATSGV